MLPCVATMLIPELPWRLEQLLLGVLIACLAWAALQILSKTVFQRQPLEKPFALLLLERVQHGAGYRAHHVAASVDPSTRQVINP